VTSTIVQITLWLQAAAHAEDNDNDLEQKRQHGKRVRYGELVQVRIDRKLIENFIRIASRNIALLNKIRDNNVPTV